MFPKFFKFHTLNEWKEELRNILHLALSNYDVEDSGETIRKNFNYILGKENVVEADHKYVGGKERNKHKEKKIPGSQGGKNTMAYPMKKKIDEYTRKLGYNIMRIRVSKDIYLPAVSDALDISVYVLKNIEDGKYPTLKIVTLFRLAKYYEVSIKDFFEGM